MATFTRSDDLRGAAFVDADLGGARFVGADLSGAVMRGVQVEGADIDAPWLLSGGASLLVNGVDVVRAEPTGPRSRRAAGRGSGRPALGLGRARAHLGDHAGARGGHARRHGRRVRGR